MLCYYFPPIIASGTTRSIAFAQNLPSYGWEPLVLSVDQPKDPWVKTGGAPPEGIRVERSSEWNLGGLCDFFQGATSKAAGLIGIDLKTNHFRQLLCLPDQQIAWSSTTRGTELAKECDVVYASCSPFSSAVSARKIKAATGKPFVLDFRDAWTLNPHTKNSSVHMAVIRKMEKDSIRECDHLILNTQGALAVYRSTYPQWAEKMSCIPNGYDELTPVEAKRDPAGVYRIMHIGSFYGSRSPRLLLEALSELPDLQIEFIQVGGDFPERAEFEGRVKMTVHPAMPRAKALEMMAQASLLFLKQGWEPGVTDYIAVAAKTYEYLATGLPILADLPPGDNGDIVQKYAATAFVITSDDKAEMKAAIKKAYENRASIAPAVKPEFIADFSRTGLTEKLAGILNSVIRR